MLRTAVPEDTEQVYELARSVMEESEFVVTTPEEMSLTIEQERNWIQSHLEDPGKLMVVVEFFGTVIGMINFQNGTRKRLEHQGMFGMSVHRSWRDKGIGSVLLLALLEWACENSLIEKIGLEVFANNQRAIHLYTKLGFLEEGRRLNQVKIDDQEYIDLILMCKFV